MQRSRRLRRRLAPYKAVVALEEEAAVDEEGRPHKKEPLGSATPRFDRERLLPRGRLSTRLQVCQLNDSNSVNKHQASANAIDVLESNCPVENPVHPRFAISSGTGMGNRSRAETLENKGFLRSETPKN
jgi:hypothetical protein